ncbi:MAG TPA: hypothetical protein VJV78_24485 [Polyangiales bacterium]|nr:hypothetical protein [Polyangiales bacterium]
MGFFELVWHKLAQFAPGRRVACVLSAAFLAGCLGGPHPLPPGRELGGEPIIPTGPKGDMPGRGPTEVPGSAAAGSAAPPVGSLGGAGGSASGSAGHGAADAATDADAGITDCDAGMFDGGDASASLCEDDR